MIWPSRIHSWQDHLLVPMEKDKGLKHWNPTIKQIYVCMCAPRHGVRKCVRVHVRTQSRLTLDSHFVFLMFFPGTPPGEVPIYHVCLAVGKCGWIRPGWCAKRSRHRTLTTNVYLAMQHKDMKEDKDLSSVFVPTLFLSLCRIYLHDMSWFDHLGFTPGRTIY